MTRGLERWYSGHDLHFITCSCYRRRPELDSGERCDLFLRVLERARQKYRFVVIGYVVMPEHYHLLITEPEVGDPSVVMKVVKERFTKLLHHGGMRTGRSGKSVSTTSMCAVRKSASRNCATCIAIL
jgi:REP element-mobilizing transposase RayT